MERFGNSWNNISRKIIPLKAANIMIAIHQTKKVIYTLGGKSQTVC
jgi:hypothetical protein